MGTEKNKDRDIGEIVLVKSFTHERISGKESSDEKSERSSQIGDEASGTARKHSQSSEAFFESIVRGSEGCLWMTIEELMTRDLVTVNEDTPIEEVFSVFAKNPYHILPVVNKKKELTGIIDLDIILEILLLCLCPEPDIRLLQPEGLLEKTQKRFPYLLP